MGLSGFVLPADSVVQWNGTPLTTTFVDSTQLFATVPANLIPTPGVAIIQVVSKGISSNFGYITVQSADLVPSISQDQVFAQGRDASYTIGLSKPGVSATVGAINAIFAIPAGLTAKSISGTNWTCQQPAGPCTYSGAIAGGGGSSLSLNVHVASDAASPQVLSATLSGGGSFTSTVTKSTSILPPGALIHADVSPAASSGTSQTFTFQFLTDLGAYAFNYVDVLINSALDGRTACYFAYVPSSNANAILLVKDGGDPGGPFSQITLNGGNTRASNSQCTIFESGSSASSSGNTLTLTLNIGFNASFAGNKVIYMAGFGAPEPSGWLTMGVYGVTPLPVTNPGATGMIPSSGSTSNAVLRYTFQDATNALNLQTAWALINTAIDGRGACYAAYYRPGNLVFLYPDNGDGSQATSMVLTGNNTISNSQCTINAAGSLVSVVGNQMIVNLNTTFKSGFTGPKGVWTAVQTLGGQTSPWQPVGAWRVP